MKLWIDDERPAPDGWEHAKTYGEAIRALASGDVDEVSFDHDLGDGPTGYDVATRLEILVAEGKIPMPVWHVHSANPVGAARIRQCMRSADRIASQLSLLA